MKPSLSVLAPIQNGEAEISGLVSRLAEILGELTPRFDLLLIDDGSNDGSLDAGLELSLVFPQVRIVRHPRPLGRSATMRTGLDRTAGEWILYRDQTCAARLDDIPKLWRRIEFRDAVVERMVLPGEGGASRLPQVARWNAVHPGLQLIQRRKLRDWPRQTEPNWLTFLAQTGAQIEEIELAREITLPVRIPSSSAPMLALSNASGTASAQAAVGAPDKKLHAHAETKAGARRPNFLERVKSFAFGE